MTRDDVIAEVYRERAHQDEKWGGPEHDDTHGSVAWRTFIADRVPIITRASVHDARRALIEIAALAVAAVESIDRRNLAGGEVTGPPVVVGEVVTRDVWEAFTLTVRRRVDRILSRSGAVYAGAPLDAFVTATADLTVTLGDGGMHREYTDHDSVRRYVGRRITDDPPDDPPAVHAHTSETPAPSTP